LVKWSKPAKKALRQIYYFISEDSKYYAKKVVEKIVSESERLEMFPKSGRVVPEIGDNKIRELIIYSYRLIYEEADKKVNVLTLIHGKRLMNKDLLKE